MYEFPKENLFLWHSGSISLSIPILKGSKRILFIRRFHDLFISDPFHVLKNVKNSI